MASKHMKQLRSKNAAERKAGIKAAAKARDRAALKRLAVMVKDDPDREIRALAHKAGLFIRHELGEIEVVQATKSDDKEKAQRIQVSDKDAKRAYELMNTAMSHQMKGERSKSIDSLNSALSLDPNLRQDGYFISLVETVTEKEGQAAIAALKQNDLQDTLHKLETSQRREKQATEHRRRVEQVRWNGVVLDAALLTVVLCVGFVMIMLLTVQRAQAYVTHLENNAVALASANVVIEDGERVYYSPNELNAAGKPLEIKVIEYSPQFRSQAADMGETPFLTILGTGVGGGVAVAAAILVMVALTHLSARVFGGSGKLPYLMHQLLSLMMGRGVILFVLAAVGIVLYFEFGGGRVTMIALGAIGIFLLTVLLKLVQETGDAYQFGLGQSAVATLVGLIPIGAVVGGMTVFAGMI